MLKLAGSQVFILLFVEVLGSKSEWEPFVVLSLLVDEDFSLITPHGEDKELLIKNFDKCPWNVFLHAAVFSIFLLGRLVCC